MKNKIKKDKIKIRYIPDPPPKDPTKSNKENYDIFLRSSYWRCIRKIKLEQAGGKCQICGSKTNLNVHHNTYAHHYKEHKHLEDLVVLCSDCHSTFHKKLTNQQKQ